MEIFHKSKEKLPSKDSEMVNSSAWLPPMLLPEVLIFLTSILLSNLDHLRTLIPISIDPVELLELVEAVPVSLSSPRDRK